MTAWGPLILSLVPRSPAHTASEVTGRPGLVYLEPRPYLTATHRLCSQQVSAADLLFLEQLHSGPKGLALRTRLRPSFP